MLAPSPKYAVHLAATARAREEAAVLAEEARYLLATQGTAYVLRALGYDKPASLARRLHRHGYDDVADIFEEMDNATAAA